MPWALGCVSREGGRVAIDLCTLAARWRGWNEASAGGTN